MNDERSARPSSRLQNRAIAGLAITQIIGWGTTYNLPAVIDDRLSADLGLSRELVFAGVTVMLVMGALTGPGIGRLIDRLCAGRILTAGSSIIAIGFVVMSMATGAATFYPAWILFGIGVPTALSIPAITKLTEISGAGARRAIGILLLFTGLSASIAWPITSWLVGLLGWRMTCLVFAAAHLLICLPIHYWLIYVTATDRAASGAGARVIDREGLVKPIWRRAALRLTALLFSLQGFVSWGLSLQLISIFEGFGIATAMAITIAAMTGPAAVAARITEVFFGDRGPPLLSVIIGTLVLPLSFALIIAGPRNAHWALLFVLVWSAANGLMSIARATLPMVLFGPNGYGELLGKLSLPQHLVFAAAPVFFAALIDRAGLDAALWVATVCEVLACVALLGLISMVRR